jgi:DNA polymerase-1
VHQQADKSDDERPILLLDTYSLFFRAYHALPSMSTTQGEPTNAIYGVSSLFIKLIREHVPSGIAWAVDAPAHTFRHVRYPAYKANRPPRTNELSTQFDRLRQLMAATGAPSFAVPGFEADDVLATIAAELRAKQRPVLIVSGDRDLLQLARGSVEVLFIGRRGKDAVRYDSKGVEARYGVPPDRLPTVFALVGEPSDNLPGVRGVGPSTAAKLVRAHHDAEGIVAALATIEPKRLREPLREHADQLLVNEHLARLREDVELEARARYEPLGEPGFEGLAALFEELEFKTLLPRLAAVRATLA